MCAALAEPPLPFLCINVESSRERLQWQREQSATFGVSVVPVAAVVPGSDAYVAGERRFGHLWMRGENEWRGPAANAIVLSWLGALRRAAKRKEAWVLVGGDLFAHLGVGQRGLVLLGEHGSQSDRLAPRPTTNDGMIDRPAPRLGQPVTGAVSLNKSSTSPQRGGLWNELMGRAQALFEMAADAVAPVDTRSSR